MSTSQPPWSSSADDALWEHRLSELYERHLEPDGGGGTTYYKPGRGYLPAEPGAERDLFGVAFCGVGGHLARRGDCATRFPIASISKVFAYALALEDHGAENLMKDVGVEPSGDAFSSIHFDERNRRPYNPMVNAGALVTATLVRGRDSAEKLERIVDLMRRFAGNDYLAVNDEWLAAEYETAARNRATAFLLHSEDMLPGDPQDALELYLSQCSVSVTCRDLAVMGGTLANACLNPITGERALSIDRVRDLLSVMFTCGMYNYAGQWAFEVGLPAKSAVSGGVLAVAPSRAGIAVFSPGLDAQGNSIRGIRVCHEVSSRLGLHMFAADGEDPLLGAYTRSVASAT